jgi:hypothetical protein
MKIGKSRDQNKSKLKIDKNADDVRYLPIQISKLNTLKIQNLHFQLLEKKFDKHRMIFSFFCSFSEFFKQDKFQSKKRRDILLIRY